jgi:hypothetical protein
MDIAFISKSGRMGNKNEDLLLIIDNKCEEKMT